MPALFALCLYVHLFVPRKADIPEVRSAYDSDTGLYEQVPTQSVADADGLNTKAVWAAQFPGVFRQKVCISKGWHFLTGVLGRFLRTTVLSWPR